MMEQVNHSSINKLIPPDTDLDQFNQIIKNLPEVVKTKLELSRVFKSIHKKMNQDLYYHDILDSVFNSLDSLIPFDRIGIALIENGGKDIRLTWVKSKLPIHSLKKDYVTKINGSSLHKILTTQEPRIINDLMDYLSKHPTSESTKLALQDGVHSSLTCPLILNGSPLGVIFFSSAKPCTYEISHIDIFFEIAEGLAIIIQQGLMKERMSEIISKESIFRNTIHDLNNPLSIIQATLDIINKKEWGNELGEDSKKALGILRRNCDSMINLVQDLTQMNKLKSGKEPLKPTPVVIDSFLSEIMNDCEVMSNKKDIHFTLTKIPMTLNAAVLDAFRIKEALENYISNAIKYSNNKTHVAINVELNQKINRLYFTVTDEGPGIPESEMSLLFTEFGKTSVRPTANESSTGLGLSNVKRLIETHGGEVFVKSQLGVGSTFGFWIPYQAE